MSADLAGADSRSARRRIRSEVRTQIPTNVRRNGKDNLRACLRTLKRTGRRRRDIGERRAVSRVLELEDNVTGDVGIDRENTRQTTVTEIQIRIGFIRTEVNRVGRGRGAVSDCLSANSKALSIIMKHLL